MSRNPDFYLTAAGEYTPLAEPRACWVIERLSDAPGDEYLLVEIRPAFVATDSSGADICTVVLSARHRGDSFAAIASWPMHVYVSRILDERLLRTPCFNKAQLEVIAWGRLYRSFQDAARDAERHATAVGTIRSPEIVHAEKLRFLGEQDGVPERLLKDNLVKLFEADERIWKAYLAEVDYGPGTPIGVTLCLRTVMGPDSRLVKEVGTVFASLFQTRECLDILFIDGGQEVNLAPVCTPFYIRTLPRNV